MEYIGDHLWLELLIQCPVIPVFVNRQTNKQTNKQKMRRNILHLVWSGATCSLFLVHGIKSLEDDFCTKWRI